MRWAAAAGCLLGAGLSEGARAESGAFALIEVNARDGGIEIAASALALTAGEYDAEMVIDRRGAGGTVSTRQGRKLSLGDGETGDISRVGVSYQVGDSLVVTVTVKRDGIVIAESTLSAPKN